MLEDIRKLLKEQDESDINLELFAASDIRYLLSLINKYKEGYERLLKNAEDEDVVNLHFSKLFVRRVCLDILEKE